MAFKNYFRLSILLSVLLGTMTVFCLNVHSTGEEDDEDIDVNLILAFAVDVSNSVDADDYQLQTVGIMSALMDKDVMEQIQKCNPRDCFDLH